MAELGDPPYMTNSIRVRFVGLVFLGALSAFVGAGCGGGGDGGSCGVAPCGGNLEGTWTFTGGCLNEAALAEEFAVDECPTATISNTDVAQTGTATFTATGYTLQGTLSVSFSLNIPASCYQPLTCADVNTLIQQEFAGNDSFQSVSCSGSGTCSCRFTGAQQALGETGTYTVSGNSFTATSTGGVVTTQDYCVQGNTAHFVEVEPTGAMRILSDQVATRQ